MKFSELDLDPKVLQALEEAGYESPTPIQEKAIPVALMGRDVLGIAQTGTGKTAAFTLPMITILSQGRARARMPRSLILCPTRELAAQVAENFETYGKYHKLTMALLIGGVSFKDQDKKIDRGVDVLIATPGRLLDHHERGKLMLTGVQVMVVDEADRMLDMGFIPDIERIFNLTPFTRQTLFFSATMPAEITRLTEAFLHNPERIEVARQSTASETIEQMVCMHAPKGRLGADKEKRDLLQRLIEDEGDALTNAIVFCNRKRDVDVVMKALKKSGMNAAAIHGDLEQSERMRVLAGFRDNQIRIMVASDVAARGLDIPTVSHVYNYDVPIHAEDYVHRIGRTGRAGRSGKSITLCFPHEQKHLDKIEELLNIPIKVMIDPMASAPTPAMPAPAAPAPATAEAPAQQAAAAPEADGEPKRKRTRAPSRRRKTTEAEVSVDAAPSPAIAPAATAEPVAEPAVDAPVAVTPAMAELAAAETVAAETVAVEAAAVVAVVVEAAAVEARAADIPAVEPAKPEPAKPEPIAEAAAAEPRPARAPRVSRRRARNKVETTGDEAATETPAPEAAPAAASPPAEEQPARSRRGGRRNRSAGRDEAKPESVEAAVAEAKPAPRPEPRSDPRPEPRSEPRAQPRASSGRVAARPAARAQPAPAPQPQAPARRDRGGRIIGMGDHVPAFMQLEIDVQALIRASSRSDDKDEVAPASDAA